MPKITDYALTDKLSMDDILLIVSQADGKTKKATLDMLKAEMGGGGLATKDEFFEILDSIIGNSIWLRNTIPRGKLLYTGGNITSEFLNPTNEVRSPKNGTFIGDYIIDSYGNTLLIVDYSVYFNSIIFLITFKEYSDQINEMFFNTAYPYDYEKSKVREILQSRYDKMIKDNLACLSWPCILFGLDSETGKISSVKNNFSKIELLSIMNITDNTNYYDFKMPQSVVLNTDFNTKFAIFDHPELIDDTKIPIVSNEGETLVRDGYDLTTHQKVYINNCNIGTYPFESIDGIQNIDLTFGGNYKIRGVVCAE